VSLKPVDICCPPETVKLLFIDVGLVKGILLLKADMFLIFSMSAYQSMRDAANLT